MPVQEKIRVLIVDDIAETRDNLRRLLQFDHDLEVIGAALSGKEALEMTMRLKPDVIIMDINMPDIDGISATEAIRRKVPYVQVVILSVQSDPSYMRRAMLAGARDYLAKPPSIDELTAAIHNAGAFAKEERAKISQTLPNGSTGGGTAPFLSAQGKVIAVYSPKGGTGKTTLATNLAISLKNEENQVVIIDANVQYGDVSVFLNEPAKNSILDLTQRVDDIDAEIVREVTITHKTSSVQFIAAPPRPEMGDQVGGDQFGKLLHFLRQVFNFIIVDTSSYMTEVVQVAIDNADVIVLLGNQDIPTIKNINAFLNLSDSSGIKRDHILLTINAYDKRISISPERIGETLHQQVAAVIPFDDKVIINSINRGIPITMENRVHPVSKSILALADTIKTKITKLDEEIPVRIRK